MKLKIGILNNKRIFGIKMIICPGYFMVILFLIFWNEINLEKKFIENEFACIRLTFDVCERQPQQRWEGGFTCA